MSTITLADFIKYSYTQKNNLVFATYNGTEEWFELNYLIDTCEEQDIPFDEVIITYFD